MRIHRLIVPLLLLLAASAPSAQAQYVLENAFPNLSFTYAVDMQSLPGTPNRLFVVEKRGVISVFPESAASGPADRTVFLDITSKVTNSGEAGLVGLAFHPNYANNGYFFVYYVSKTPYRNTIARYKVTADPNVADPASEFIVVEQSKNNLFHNGGQLAFGPDGFLYATMGDDTSSPNGQDLDDLLGSMLRIAPNVAGTVPAYTIPNSNPFKGNTNGYREEIFAYGFRNPWRFSIDPTGRIWGTDVGENNYEEIDWIVNGANYGWPLMEGPVCFQPSSCDTAGKNLKLPVDYYDHSLGSAVIGGNVYHGSRLLELEGRYIFADYNGVVWSLQYQGVDPPVRTDLIASAPALLAFGLGGAPERDLYISSSDGAIYRLARSTTAVSETPSAARGRLLGNFPNPFNPTTTIRYEMARPGRVAIEIVSVDGSRVRLLQEGSRGAGVHAVLWRGESDGGGRAASGVYFYRLVVDGVAIDSARMVLVQ